MTNLWIITNLSNYLSELQENKKYFTRDKDFTRQCTFSFLTLFCLLTNLPRKSLDLELALELEGINSMMGLKTIGTKSGFGKARKKIKWELFEAFNQRLNKLYYENTKIDSLSRWNGFLLRGVDGTILNIVDNASNRSYFGEGGNDKKKICQGRAIISYDPLNGLIDKAYLGKMSIGESSVVKGWIKDRATKELSIYDRAYPGLCLQYLHEYYGSPYLMRCKLSHNQSVKDFLASGEFDRIETWKVTKNVSKELADLGIKAIPNTTIYVRLLRIILSTGEVEVLLTNLIDRTQYPHLAFKDLYFFRWPAETIIGFLKNTLAIELTSGHKPLNVMQDFWGTIIRANVQALMEEEMVDIIAEHTEHRQLDYQINHSFVAGYLKVIYPKLWLLENKYETYRKVVELCAKHVEPLRKGRKYERNVKKHRRKKGKYLPLNNYKRVV